MSPSYDAPSITLDFGIDNVRCSIEPLRKSNVVALLESLKELQQSIAHDEPIESGPLSSPDEHNVHGATWAQDRGRGGAFGTITPALSRSGVGHAGMNAPHTPYLRNRMSGSASNPYGHIGTPHQKRMFQPLAPEWGTGNPFAAQPPVSSEDSVVQSDRTPLDVIAAVLMSNVSINILVQHFCIESHFGATDSDDLILVLDVGRPPSAVSSPLDKEVRTCMGCASWSVAALVAHVIYAILTVK